ncbi:MAG: bifunctional phosphopantothenoylcysteine decarboxylase/phosphopantothenate--cysteine ligase CoaBC [Kofleriaceae bacterium]
MDATAQPDPSAPLRGATVVVAVGGGIAVYKVCELVRQLDKAGADVHVAMTARATQFVTPLTFQALSRHPVFTDLFSLTEEASIGHIQLADRADLVIVAPATASLIARLAAGYSDDPVTAVVLATKAKVLLAPSMNTNMWSHPITQRNIRCLLNETGAEVVGPGSGFLACRWTGPGRLAEPADIVEAAASLRTRRDLTGRRVVISAGPTHEAVDPARYLANRSSGKMGIALATAARRRGAAVTLVLGPSAEPPPIAVEVERVTSARQMREAVHRAAAAADAVIMAAAVGDFRPREEATDKLKREALGEAPTLPLVANPDILAELGAARGHAIAPLLVGFAAETRDLVTHARRKLASKRCDLIVANDVSQPGIGFGSERNAVTLVDDGGVVAELAGGKGAVAHGILDEVVRRLALEPRAALPAEQGLVAEARDEHVAARAKPERRRAAAKRPAAAKGASRSAQKQPRRERR